MEEGTPEQAHESKTATATVLTNASTKAVLAVRCGMPRDEKVKKARDAGFDLLELARSKAEEFLRELSRSGESAQEVLDDLAQGGRRGTDRLIEVIRSEVARQLGVLGLVTKEDLADLERRIDERFAEAAPSDRAKSTTGVAATAATTSATRTASASDPTAATGPSVPKPAARAAKATGTRPAKAPASRPARPSRPTGGEGSGAVKPAASKSPANRSRPRPSKKNEG